MQQILTSDISMTYATEFGALSTLMVLSSRANYFSGIFRGKVHPHMFSWVIWCVISAIGFTAQMSQGAGAGGWSRGFACITSFMIVLFACRKGTNYIKRSDWITLAVALSAIPLWIITRTPLWSVILVCTMDVLGCYPTLRKAWNRPYEEAVRSYLFSGIGGIFSLIAIEHYSPSTWLCPAEGLCANIMLISCLMWRRKKLAIAMPVAA